jgi:hypothetical protein
MGHLQRDLASLMLLKRFESVPQVSLCLWLEIFSGLWDDHMVVNNSNAEGRVMSPTKNPAFGAFGLSDWASVAHK